AREQRVFPRTDREDGAAAATLGQGQRGVAPRKVVELARDTLDRLLHLPERRIRQHAADAPELLPRARERRVEELELHLACEKLLHGSVWTPREIARGQEPHALQR